MAECAAQIQACATRVARLEQNGVPDPGAGNILTTDTQIEVTFEPVIDEGTEHIQPNGCGSLVVNYKEEDEIKRFNITARFARPDPELAELMMGGRLFTASGSRQGYAYPRLGVPISPYGVSFELWAKRLDSNGIDLDPTYPYARWAFPRVRFRPGPKTFGNAAQVTEFVGFAIENPNWYNGPVNDWPDDLEEAVAWMPVATLPTVQCGATAVAAS